MKTSYVSQRWFALAAGANCALATLSVNAAPYASGLTSIGGGVSFVLNEDADNVTVLLNSGMMTNELGALQRGSNWFGLNGAADFQIVVYRAGRPGYRWADGGTVATSSGTWRSCSINEISDPSSPLLLFNAPRGMAVNRRPGSPYFGRVYVANGADPASGYTSNFLGVIRNNASADGIYMLNADGSDAVGQGDTARTAGLSWTTHADSPGRLFLGPDDRLYICDRGSPASAGLYMTDASVSATSGTNILQAFSGGALFPVGAANTHGRIDCVDVTGSLDTSNLRIYMQDADLQPDKTTSTKTKLNSIWRSPSTDLLAWEKLPYAGNFDLTGDKFTSPQNHQNNSYGAASDYEKGPNGYYYLNVPRDDGNTFFVFNGSFSGSALFNARNAGDTALSGYCLGLSPDAKYVAIGTRLNGHVIIYPTDGGFVPVHARRVFLPIGPGENLSNRREREVRFDAASNMYVLQENVGLRVFSPGGASLAITGNDASLSSGDFSVQFGPALNPQPADTIRSANQNATFGVVADGTEPLAYQWVKDGNALSDDDHVSGASTATLTLLAPLACAADNGNYQVIVSNAVGVVTSLVASLTVRDPAILAQPSPQTNALGETAQFSVTAVGSGAIAYQWRRGGLALANGPTGWGSIILGANSNVLSIVNVSEADASYGDYAVVVSGLGNPECSTNTVTSQERSLTIRTPLRLAISGDPAIGLALTWPTEVGKYYELHYTTNLNAPVWTPIDWWSGDGWPRIFTEPAPVPDVQRFYRLFSQ